MSWEKPLQLALGTHTYLAWEAGLGASVEAAGGSLSLVLMPPGRMIDRFYNFVVEVKSVCCGINTHEAALGEGLGTWLTLEESAAVQPGGMLQPEG